MSEFIEPPYADQRRVEMIFDKAEFELLYNMACDVCLGYQPTIEQDSVGIDPEAAVITELGTRGIRYALEQTIGVEQSYTLAYSKKNDLRIDPLSRPDFFSGPMDRRQLAKVEAFGAELLKTAWYVLGSDAADYIRTLQQAKTDDEYKKVLSWLERRLYKIVRMSRGLEEVEDPVGDSEIYHPLRLSPQAIGVYPNTTLSPTCLGVATIAASFLSQAGADILHAGVMETSQQREMKDTDMYIRSWIGKMCTMYNVSLTDELQQRLLAKSKELRAKYQGDDGNHSCVLTRLPSGEWYQLDSNYQMSGSTKGAITTSSKPAGEEIDSYWKLLHEFRDRAPGLELSFATGDISPIAVFVALYNQALEDGFLTSLREELATLVDTMPDESSIEPIRQFISGIYFGDYTTETSDDQMTNTVLGRHITFNNYASRRPDGNKESVRNAAFYECFERYVLWGMDIEEWRERCSSDNNFRERCIDDLLRLPFLMALTRQLKLISRTRSERERIHRKLEIGLPELRIGFSVLNNFAIHSDSGPSAHHWLSQWSSHLVERDQLSQAECSRSQKAALSLAGAHYLTKRLTYSHHADTILTFLEESTRAHDKKEQSDA